MKVRDIMTRDVRLLNPNQTIHGRPVDTKVAAVMSKEVLYCFDTDDLDDVSRNMGKAQVRRLPVINADKRPDNDRSNRDAGFHAGRQARPDLDALTSEWQ